MPTYNDLSSWRKGNGYTQQALAVLLGRDHKSVSAYETGRNSIPPEVGDKLRELGYEGPLSNNAKPLQTLIEMSFGEIHAEAEKIVGEIEASEARKIPPVLRSELMALVGEEVQECARLGHPERARQKVARWWALIREKGAKSQ